MPKNVVLRAAAAPLTSAHLALHLRARPRFDRAAADWMNDTYFEVATEALEERIERDPQFAAAIAGLVYQPTGKSVARLSPVQQFMALSKTLHVRAMPADGAPDLHGLTLREPFVLSYATLAQLDAMRLSESDPATSRDRLESFVEAHVGTPCLLEVE